MSNIAHGRKSGQTPKLESRHFSISALRLAFGSDVDRRRQEVSGFPQCLQEPFRYFAAFWAIEITTEFLFVGMATTT